MGDRKKLFKLISPYLVALFVFVGITLVYFSPMLEGKKLKQHDIEMYKGMSKEITDFRAASGEEPLWTNSMFGGMPAWQISVRYSGNLMGYVDQIQRCRLQGGFVDSLSLKVMDIQHVIHGQFVLDNEHH